MYGSVLLGLIGWLLVIILSLVSVFVLSGKGGTYIAWFTNAGKKKVEEYNKKRLKLIIGGGFSLMAIMLAIFLFFGGEPPHYLNWVYPAGYLIVVGLMFLLSNSLHQKEQS